MNTKPYPEEHDWYGVCREYGRMTGLIIQNKAIFHDKGFKITDDYREVTVCCGSEDYIPEEYAVRCNLCNEWVDQRYTYKIENKIICDICYEEVIKCRET